MEVTGDRGRLLEVEERCGRLKEVVGGRGRLWEAIEG